MTRRWMNVCVGLLLLMLAEHPDTKGEAAPTFQPAILSASTHTPENDDFDEEFYASVGHVIVLPCDGAESQNVTWRREGAPPMDTAVAGAEVRGGALWFLPADSSHSGVYVCESDADPWRVSLRVDHGVCPKNNADWHLDLGSVGRLPCGQEHIFKSAPKTRISWLKDCESLNSSEQILAIPQVLNQHKGNYTCLLHFSLDGHNYTSASTTQVFIATDPGQLKPQVIVPRNETRVVELGSRLELRCEATTGETTVVVSWKMNRSTIRNNTLFTITMEDQGSRVVKTLIISEVREEHLNVPFQCWATNALGQDFSQILLRRANHGMFYCVVGLAVACGLLLVCVYLCWARWVDLVLLYRSICPVHHKRCDGKLYDAYVSYPRGDGVSMAMTFALRVLPEVLESNYGYKLFIRGRDDLPGEAVFDGINDTLEKSRRLIIVLDGPQTDSHEDLHAPALSDTHTPALSDTHTDTHAPALSDTHTDTHTPALSDTHTDTHTPALSDTHTDTHTTALSDTHTDTHAPTSTELIPLTFPDAKTHTLAHWPCQVTHTQAQDTHSEQECFERSLGEYQALVDSRGLKVLVIQTGEGRGLLPPPLQLLTRSKHPLRWPSHTHTRTHTRTRTHTQSQPRFWKELRYRMPAPRRAIYSAV